MSVEKDRKTLLLAVDTSTKLASVALYDGVRVRAEMTWEAPRRHTVELAPQVVEMLGQIKAGVADLTGLVVAIGPGSFTGLRIGLALVKGLALSRGIPLVGVPTLDVTAYPLRRRQATLYPTLQAGRGRVCLAPYRWRRGRWRRVGDLDIATWERLAKEAAGNAIFSGEIDAQGLRILAERETDAHDSAKTIKTIIVPPAQRLRRAGYLAELGWHRLRQGEHDDPASLQPIYLHTT
jgi:tRNA threonylcarbamoyladenosine biosynthesis protein TsaB